MKKGEIMEVDMIEWNSLEGPWVEELEASSMEFKLLEKTMNVLDVEKVGELESFCDADVDLDLTDEYEKGFVASIEFFAYDTRNYSAYLTLHELRDGSLAVENYAREYLGGTVSSFIRVRK